MRIKIFRIILFTFCIGFILISCGKSSKEVFRIDSLNDSCWQSSLWISVANAPVGKHSKKCTFYTLRFGCSFAAVNTIKPQLL